MKKTIHIAILCAASAVLGPGWLPTALAADPTVEALETRVKELEASIAELRGELGRLAEQNSSKAAAMKEERGQISEESATVARAEAASIAAEWQNATSAFHLSGYGAASYVDQEGANGEFGGVTFNPILHFQYRNQILWESELELEIDQDGATDVTLEYSTIDWLINDHVTLLAGKFLSPLGQFRQNLHPAWINKLPSAPPGFGHDGAAPAADVGVQLRGGLPLPRAAHLNYAVYVGNGPQLEADGGEIHGIVSEGFTRNADDPVVGGRLGFLPMPNLEIGVSGAVGKATLTTADGVAIEDGDEPARDYGALGADLVYRWKDLEGRGELIRQKVDDAPGSLAEEGGTWRAWYLQLAYRLGSRPWEGIVRYSDFNSPHPEQRQDQWMIGFEYLIASNAMVKLGYEFNDGLSQTETDANRWLLQLAYGY